MNISPAHTLILISKSTLEPLLWNSSSNPPRLEHTIFKGTSPLWPLLPGKTIKLLLLCVYALSLSHVWLFVTLRTIAHRLLCPQNSPGQNTGVGSHSLLQGNLETQGSNLSLLHCRWILYCVSPKTLSPRFDLALVQRGQVSGIIFIMYHCYIAKNFQASLHLEQNP